MFAKRAKSSIGPISALMMAAACNDNYARRRSNPKPLQRYVLACHWRVRPLTGALVCV
jgi:hypothetical protein